MSRAHLLRFAALSVMWGSSFLFIKVALTGLSPVQIVLGRLLAGALVLLAIVRLRGQRLPADRRIWGHLLLMGVVANIVPFFLFGWGEQRITSGLAGVLNGTTPLFTLGVATAFLPQERLTTQRALGFVLGFLGVLLVVGPWDHNPLISSIPGQLACLAAAASYGVGFVYTRRFLAGRYEPLPLAAGQLTAATLTLAALVPLWATPVELSAPVLGSIVALGTFGTGLAYLLYYRLLTEVGATTTSTVTYLIPVVAVTLGILILGEPVTWNLFAGVPVVLLGVALAEGRLRLRPRPRHPVRPAPDPLGGDFGRNPG